MAASSWQSNGINAGGGTNFVSSLGALIAKTIANPFGVVFVVMGGAVIAGVISGIVMTARHPSPQRTLIVHSRPGKSASDENLRRSPSAMQQVIDKLAANNQPQPDQRKLVNELRRQNSELHRENQSLRSEKEDNSRRMRAIENAIAELKRRWADREYSGARPRHRLTATYARHESGSGAAALTPTIVRNRRRPFVPRSFSGYPLTSSTNPLHERALRTNSRFGIALREAARKRREVEALERAARRRAAVEFGIRQKRRSAFNRVFDQR